MKVDLRCLCRFVTEPEGDHGVVNASTEEFHSCRVTAMPVPA
jgi:hypothetical protein